MRKQEEGKTESGFAKIHFPSKTNTSLLILSPLAQCSFLLCSSDVYLAGFLGDAGGFGVSWGYFIDCSKRTNR